MVYYGRKWAVILGLVVGMGSGVAGAQQRPLLSASVSAPDAMTSAPEPITSSTPQPLANSSPSAIRIVPPMSGEQRVADRQFWMLAAFTAGSAVFDGETTIRALQSPGRRELNPFLGSHPDRARFYATVGATDAAITYLAYRLKRRGHDKLWKIPLLGATSAHIGGAINNLQY